VLVYRPRILGLLGYVTIYRDTQLLIQGGVYVPILWLGECVFLRFHLSLSLHRYS
jgi:hypothetical protein